VHDGCRYAVLGHEPGAMLLLAVAQQALLQLDSFSPQELTNMVSDLKEHTRDVFWLYLYNECTGVDCAQKLCFAHLFAALLRLSLMLTCHCTSMSP